VKGFASFAPHWASIVIMKTSLTIKNVDIKLSEFPKLYHILFCRVHLDRDSKTQLDRYWLHRLQRIVWHNLMISYSIVLWEIVSKPQYVKYITSHLDMKEKNTLKINIIIIITHHNAICLYRLIWFVTFLCNILNLPVVAKVFSWNDPPSWKTRGLLLHWASTIKNLLSVLI
jgi:hypothetical protein